MMKKEFISAEIEVVKFTNEDVVAASCELIGHPDCPCVDKCDAVGPYT